VPDSQRQRRVAVRLSPKGDQLAHEVAPLVDLKYQQIEQVLGAQVLDDLFNALEAFLQVQNQPLPPVDWPPRRSLAQVTEGPEAVS
jgi:hypothetical protein